MPEVTIRENSTPSPAAEQSLPIRKDASSPKAAGLGHDLVGYDRDTDRQAVCLPVPGDALDAVKSLLDVPGSDPDMVGAYPVAADKLDRLGRLLHLPLDGEKHVFFVEGVARP